MFFFSLQFMRITLKVSFGLLVAILLTGCGDADIADSRYGRPEKYPYSTTPITA